MSEMKIARPNLRFAPQAGWINDPNGLVYDGVTYHLFAQHNPNDTVWGPMHWLHAVSDDLIHWRELGIALYPDELGTMFSGSAVIDKDDTAGFGAGAMVAIFTQHGDRQTQGIAHSSDGLHFSVYPGNPVIENPGIADFRDPKVFWDAARGRWAMALAEGDRIGFYVSSDLRTWCRTGEFGAAENRLAGVFECPDLFPLTAPDGREIWALLISMGAGPEHGGCRIQYFLGAFDGETFRQTEAVGETLMLDRGFDDYAGVTYSGTAERVFVGWAANATYAGDVPANAFRGTMTLPRRLFLLDTLCGLRLGALPMLPEVPFAPIADGGALPAKGAYELRARAASAFELSLRSPAGDELRIGLGGQNELYVDRTRAGETGFHEWFGKPMYSVAKTPRARSGDVCLCVIVDENLVEVYAEDGAYVATLLVYPNARYSELSIHNADVEVAVRT